MPDEKYPLLELYKITLEELHHQERTYIQLVTGIFIIFPLLLTAISFLLGKNSPIIPEYVYHAKWSVFSFLIIILLVFWLLIFRLDSRINACYRLLNNIELKLDSTNIHYDLLISAQLNKNHYDSSYHRVRLFIYIPLCIGALIISWIALFNWIDPYSTASTTTTSITQVSNNTSY